MRKELKRICFRAKIARPVEIPANHSWYWGLTFLDDRWLFTLQLSKNNFSNISLHYRRIPTCKASWSSDRSDRQTCIQDGDQQDGSFQEVLSQYFRHLQTADRWLGQFDSDCPARSHGCLTGEAAIFKLRWGELCQGCKFIIRENGLLHYSFGLLSLTISEAQPKLLQWKLIVKMVDNCSIQGGCKQTNRFQGE